jgi:peptidoglycan hydrolase-like protein with peptidoglycan-binding domain
LFSTRTFFFELSGLLNQKIERKYKLNARIIRIIIFILILSLSTLACGLVSGNPAADIDLSPTETLVVTQPTKEPPKEETPKEPSPTKAASESANAPQIPLGEEQRSEKGGYAFLVVPDYVIEETEGYALLVAPDGDASNGPAFFMLGGLLPESQTLDGLFEEQMQNIGLGLGMEISDPREVTVDGAPGRSIDLNGLNDGQIPVAGRITTVLVTPNQMFVFGAMAPADRWEEIAGIYDALQASITFFEPTVSGMEPEEASPAGDEIRQWAKYAYASSSYGDPDWHATQATGAPDTLVDECQDLPTAWASEGSDTVEWLELVYETPVIPTEINIIQTHSPDQVVKVELIDSAGLYQEVYTGVPMDRWEECPYTLSIPVNVNFAAGGLKITLDQSVIGTSWNEIDAVELVGFPVDGAASEPTEIPASLPPDGDVLSLQDPPLYADSVGQVKFRLAELGYEICMITTDFYNHQTEAAVHHFQMVNGLEADGIVGPQTSEALFAEDAVPAPVVNVKAVSPNANFPVMEGVAILSDGMALVILDENGTIHVFAVADGEYMGSFIAEALPAEEDYQPNAMVAIGNTLWLAQQGPGDALLQAYDVAGEPVEGLLHPIFDESIHFPSDGLHHAITSDGTRIWVLAEDLDNQQLMIQPIDLNSRSAGEPIRLGMSSDSGTGYSLTYDSSSGLLWVAYGDDVFGELGIVWVDPDRGEVGKALGPCGTQALFAGGYLLVAHRNDTPWASPDPAPIWVVDPASGEIVAHIPLEGRALAMASEGSRVWIMVYDDSTLDASVLEFTIVP